MAGHKDRISRDDVDFGIASPYEAGDSGCFSLAPLDPKFVFWRRVRVPVFVVLALAIASISAAITHHYLTRYRLARALERVVSLEARDTVVSEAQARAILERLHRAHPENESVRTRLAWHHTARALRDRELIAARRTARELIGSSNSSLSRAVRAGVTLSEGRPEEALHILDGEPGCTEAHYVRALALTRGDRGDEGLSELDRAGRAYPIYAPALVELARQLRARGRFGEAQVALGRLVRHSPDHDALSVEGVLLALDGQDAALQARLDEANSAPSRPRLMAYQRLASGRLALHRGQTARARDALEAAHDVLSDDPDVALWYARALRSAGELEEALEVLSASTNHSAPTPSSLSLRLELELALHRCADADSTLDTMSNADASRELSRWRGRIALCRGHSTVAARWLRNSADLDPELQLELAEALWRSGDIRDAQALLEEMETSSANAHCVTGLRAFLDGDNRRATSAFRAALAERARCGATLGTRVLFGSSFDARSIDAIEDTLRLRDDLRVRVTLARAFMRAGRTSEARRTLARVRALTPQGALIYEELLQAYEELDDSEEALNVALEGVERSDNDARLIAESVRLMVAQGHLADAVDLLERATMDQPNAPALLLARAHLHLASGDTTAALDAVSAARGEDTLFLAAVCLSAEAQLRQNGTTTSTVTIMRALEQARRLHGPQGEVELWACQARLQLERGDIGLARARIALHHINELTSGGRATDRWLAGRAAELIDDDERALRCYLGALELDPAHRAARRDLSELDSARPFRPTPVS